jgi:hypothetical protein
VGVVDLHDRELMHKFVIDFELFLLEGGHNLLAKVNGHDINQHSKVLKFLLSLQVILV